MGSHQRFSVLVAKYGATTNALQPERHSRYRYSFVDVRRNALRRRQIGVKLICSGSALLGALLPSRRWLLALARRRRKLVV